MQIIDYEKTLLGLIFKYPNSQYNIPQRVVSELETDKFEGVCHQRIYNAIKTLVMNKEVPNPTNVEIQLGENSEGCGGIEYIKSLLDVPVLFGLEDHQGFAKIAQKIDIAGRLRHLGMVLEDYRNYYNDFERLVAKVPDVDEFMSNFMDKINEGVASTRTSYRPIKDAVDIERRFAKQEGDGLISDLIPCGFPNLEKFMIPRPQSLGAIMALSSLGKTSLAFQLAIGVAMKLKEENKEGVVSINSLETPDRRIARTMACIISSTNSKDLAQGKLKKKQFKKYMEALDFIEELPIRYDDNPDVTTDQLSWQAIALHLQEKRIMGISDYAELFKDEGRSEELRVSNITRNHRRIAWRIGSCEILLSQASNAHAATKMILLSDARYSKAIEAALDWGIIIYNPIQMRNRGIQHSLPPGKRDDMAYLMVQKNKGYHVGEEMFYWYPEFTRFMDTSLPMGQLFSKPARKEQF